MFRICTLSMATGRYLLKFNDAIVNFRVVIKAALNVNKINVCCPGGRYIGRHITVHDAINRISIEVTHRRQQHSRCRLAAIALTRIVGVVRAEVPGVHVHAESLQLVLYVSVQAPHVGLGVKPLCDAGLVGHHDDLIVGVLGVAAHDVDRGGDQLQPLGLVKVPGVHVDRAVAVKHSKSSQPCERREHGHGELVVLGNHDVDEARGEPLSVITGNRCAPYSFQNKPIRSMSSLTSISPCWTSIT